MGGLGGLSLMLLTLVITTRPQAAEPGEENPDGGRRDPCHRVWDEAAGGFVPGETRGVGKTAPSWRFYIYIHIRMLFLEQRLSDSLLLSQSVEHLSWLGLYKDLSEGTHKPSPFYHKRALHKTREECERVREKFLQMRHVWRKSQVCSPFSFIVWDDPPVLLRDARCLPAAPCRCPRRWDSTWRLPPSITGESESKL